MKPPILVAGAQRTGTSFIAGLIAQHGVAAGRCRTTNPKYSAKGHYENKALKHLMQTALAENGRPFLFSKDWPAQMTSKPDWRLRVFDSFPEAAAGEAWVVKEVRILATWPLWRDAFPEAFYVFPRAERSGVIRSMQRHHALQIIGDEAELGHWVDACWGRQDEIAAAGARHIYVDADKMARGDMDEAARMIEALGLTFDESIARAWIDPSVWRQSEAKGVRLAKGMWFPDGAKISARANYHRPKNIETILTYVESFGTAIDAAAHIGSWPRALSRRFDQVIAIEPEPTLYHCLVRNTQDYENVRPVNGASIDSLNLTGVDFIRADAEALRGASKALKRFRPTVLLLGGGRHLAKLGARRLKAIKRDELWGWA